MFFPAKQTRYGFCKQVEESSGPIANKILSKLSENRLVMRRFITTLAYSHFLKRMEMSFIKMAKKPNKNL